MSSQSLPSGQRANADETGNEVSNSPPAPQLPSQIPGRRDDPRGHFVWDGKDVADSSLIASWLITVLRRGAHGEAIIETSVELQLREPRLADAWRFFHAAAELTKARQFIYATMAQRLGARIALAVTGWTLMDMTLAEHGSSSAFGVFLHDRETPVILPIADVATGLTAAEKSGAFTVQVAP